MAKGSEWLDADAPLFPNAAGLHCSKPGVVSGFRALSSATSALAIRGQGEIGGHTARVTGARYLAALGVELAIIQLMARHASSCIMDYVRDAPLLTITGMTKAKRAARAEQDATVVQSWSEAKLKAQLDAMALRLDALAQDQQHLAGLKINDDLLEHEETQEDPHDGELDDLTAVINILNDKAHIAKVVPAAGVAPALWRARCPWWFGFKQHRICTPSSVLADPALNSLLCRRCWRGLTQSPHGEESSSGSD